MRILTQRVKNAKVTAGGREAAEIGKGLLLFVGVGKNDDEQDIGYLCKKITNLRIFEDKNGKMNLDIRQAGGQVLSVSQFTLYADMRRGNRPGFDESAEPGMARSLWEKFNEELRKNGIDVRTGIFGAHMDVDLLNDGPVTIWLDSEEKRKK
ncbi:MAG: D-tyrosyl-tRNA(Tyr) deacylase [Nitrospiraceae bacterium]|nr:MAG: D-tyrosyl-tRNA(Tyr) deacylase [Nitrospiraceae bacterium]